MRSTNLFSCIEKSQWTELGDGHYWINEPELVIKIPLRLIGDEKDPTHVVIELSGNIAWKGCSGFMEGITFRRPRMGECTNGQEMLKIEGGHLKFIHGIVEGAKEKATAGLKETTSGCGVIVRAGKLKTEDVSETYYLFMLRMRLTWRIRANYACSVHGCVVRHNKHNRMWN